MSDVSVTKSLLLVEDDQDIRDSLREFFEREGYRVQVASDGHEALELLRSSGNAKPALVFLDLMMPRMDGRRFLDELEREPELRELPVAIMTATTENVSGRVVGLLRKPVDLDKMLDLVERYCGAV